MNFPIDHKLTDLSRVLLTNSGKHICHALTHKNIRESFSDEQDLVQSMIRDMETDIGDLNERKHLSTSVGEDFETILNFLQNYSIEMKDENKQKQKKQERRNLVRELASLAKEIQKKQKQMNSMLEKLQRIS